jgi:excisionase family DNA binding protein
MRQEVAPDPAYKPGYLSIEGAAKYAGVSAKTIKRWKQRGLPVYQGTPRGKVLIRPSDIDAYLTRSQAPQVDLNAMVEEVIRELSSGPKAA